MSEEGTPLPLEKALKYAEQIVEQLRPYCELIEIAGSIRRGCPMVGDIDIVCLPSNRQAVRERVLKSNPKIIQNGDTTIEVLLKNKVRLDVWMASHKEPSLFEPQGSNWGSLLLVRTGSKQHNIRLLGRAEAMGLRWNTYHGVYDYRGNCIACSTEVEIFDALKLPYVLPEERR